MVDVYISPENRNYPHGPYNGQDTYEKEQCELIADELEKVFKRCGVTYLRADADAGMAARCKEANAEGHKIYLSVHTNAAGGTNTTVRGTSVFYYGPQGTPSYKAASYVLNELVALGLKNRGLTDKSDWYEPRNSTGATVYCEIEFHDHKDGAAWIVSHRPEIAEAITKGICQYVNKTYVESVTEEYYIVKDPDGNIIEQYPYSEGETTAIAKFTASYGNMDGYVLYDPNGEVVMKGKKNPDTKTISWDDLRGVLKEQMGIEMIEL